MKKIFIPVFITISVAAFSQTGKVGVNSSAPTEIFDVNGTARVRQLPVSGTANSIFTKTDGTASASKDQTFTATRTMVADANGVVGSTSFAPQRFFYMPSVAISTTTLATDRTLDLYTIYSTQFSNPSVKSAGSSGSIQVYPKDRLEYYVTYFDNTVFSNITIDANGLMTYSVISNATDASFMNIVFQLKN